MILIRKFRKNELIGKFETMKNNQTQKLFLFYLKLFYS